VAWPVPELAEGAAAGVLRPLDELLPDELLPDEPDPEAVDADDFPDPPEEFAACVLCAAFWAEADAVAPAAPGRV
jgi:hypothetical protein